MQQFDWIKQQGKNIFSFIIINIAVIIIGLLA